MLGQSSTQASTWRSQSQALIATLEFVADSLWYVDSSVPNHLTYDDSNLSTKSNYASPDQVFTDDCSCLFIQTTI